jgi:hypothetical protein
MSLEDWDVLLAKSERNLKHATYLLYATIIVFIFSVISFGIVIWRRFNG